MWHTRLQREERCGENVVLTLYSNAQDTTYAHRSALQQAGYAYSGEPFRVWTRLAFSPTAVSYSIDGLLSTGALQAHVRDGRVRVRSGLCTTQALRGVLPGLGYQFDVKLQEWHGPLVPSTVKTIQSCAAPAPPRVSPEETNRRAQKRKRTHATNALTSAETSLMRRIEDQVGAHDEWPSRLLLAFTSREFLRRPARFELTLFLLHNGCPPDLYAEWLLSRPMLRDASAREHVASLIGEHQAGTLAMYTAWTLPGRRCAPPRDLDPKDRKHPWDGVGEPMPDDPPAAWCMQPVAVPTGAQGSDISHQWAAAIAMLRSPAGSTNAMPGRAAGKRARVAGRINCDVRIVPYLDGPDVEDNGMYARAERLA